MLVTAKSNLQNRRLAFGVAGAIVIVISALALASPWWLLAVPLALLAYWLVRRKSLRRITVGRQPIPEQWDRILIRHVDFYRALDDAERQRFCKLMNVFLDEVAITGIRTDVDETTRVLVAASAIIPVFGFQDWEYAGLGEVLIYPNAFGDQYRTDDSVQRNTLGMIGDHHLSGVMILSKPDLLAGFDNSKDRRNVGIHEFAHLIDKADGSVDGLPATTPAQTVDPWIQWVACELRSDSDGSNDISDYAYTNEAEYFAVLSEYFFETPALLEKRHPELYQMLQSIYHQNTKGMFAGLKRRPKRFRRNDRCPCGSGKKYKYCCGR